MQWPACGRLSPAQLCDEAAALRGQWSQWQEVEQIFSLSPTCSEQLISRWCILSHPGT